MDRYVIEISCESLSSISPQPHCRHSLTFLKGTTDLAIRIGLNSGPITAGVLRGEKARFQLFGDVSLVFVVHCNFVFERLTYILRCSET